MAVVVAILSILLAVLVSAGVIYLVLKSPLKLPAATPPTAAVENLTPPTAAAAAATVVPAAVEAPPADPQPASPTNACSSLSSAVAECKKNASYDNKLKLAQEYASLLCEYVKSKSTKQLLSEIEYTYKEDARIILDAVSTCINDLQPCNGGTIASENYWLLPFTQGSELSSQHCPLAENAFGSGWEKLNTRLILGKDKYDNMLKWSHASCGLLHTPSKGAEPQEIKDAYGGILSAGGAGCPIQPKKQCDLHVTENAIKMQEQKCVTDWANKGQELTHLQMQRNADDIDGKCTRTNKYSNADDWGKLDKGFEWTVPQQRCPVCVTNAPCKVDNTYFQTGLIGTLLTEADYTIMPKFEYKEFC